MPAFPAQRRAVEMDRSAPPTDVRRSRTRSAAVSARRGVRRSAAAGAPAQSAPRHRTRTVVPVKSDLSRFLTRSARPETLNFQQLQNPAFMTRKVLRDLEAISRAMTTTRHLTIPPEPLGRPRPVRSHRRRGGSGSQPDGLRVEHPLSAALVLWRGYACGERTARSQSETGG
jgi:hypothetical protein